MTGSETYSTDDSRIAMAGQDGTMLQWVPVWSGPIDLVCRSLRDYQSLLSPITESEKVARSICHRWCWR